MNETSTPPTSPPPLPPAPPVTRGTLGAAGPASWLVWTALGTGVLALAGVAAVAVQTQSRDEAVQQALGQKVADLDRQLGQSAALTRRLQTQVIDAQNRLEQFETQLADTQTQRIALEEMYRELSRAPDDWLLAEVEQTLNIAAQQLAVAGNAKAAIIALQSADARLARADKLQTAAMRRAINADLEKLKALPWVDLTGMTVKLDALVQQIDALPLATGPGSIVATPPANIRKAEEGWFSRLADDAWREFRELVRIRKVGADETGLLTPNQTYFLKENLKLRLLSARMALLARDETNFREDLKLARGWIAKYFDVQAKPTAAALANLKVLQDSALNIALPDINTSLNAVGAVRAARAARDTNKGGADMPAALRAILWLLGLAVLAVAIALAGKYSDGHVLILAAGYRIELSLNLAVVLVVAGFTAFYVLVRALTAAWQAPRRIAQWQQEKARDTARSDLLQALRGLFSGRFDSAERAARRLAEQREAGSELQDMGATVAAWAAFEAGQPARALPYLKEIAAANDTEGGSMRDASLAYVLLADGKAAEALPLLRRLNAADPRNPGVLKMKLEAELAERQWVAVLETLRGVVKTGLMPDLAAKQIRQHAELEIIKEKAGSRDALLAFWRDLDSTSRFDADIAGAVARALNHLACGAEAAQVIEESLERGGWDSGLARLYGDCRADSTLVQIERAEKWLRNQARDPALLMALGKLCMRQGLWGKAQSYLEASVALAPSLEAHMTLANLMERLGKPAEAARHIRRSAELAG